MPQVRGLLAHRVWRVSLLQGHEEVRRAREDETVLHYAAVHCGERLPGLVAWAGGGGIASRRLAGEVGAEVEALVREGGGGKKKREKLQN